MVDHYNDHFDLLLTEAERNDLVEFLKSIPAREPKPKSPWETRKW